MNNFPRRDFLRRTLGAATAALLTKSLGQTAFAFARTLSPENFEMLVLGDSIMWGQGLNDEFKFYNLIKNWLERPEILNRHVNVTLEADSGANIFPDKDVIRPLAQKRHGEINVSNPPILFQVESALDNLLKLYPSEPGGIATIGRKVDHLDGWRCERLWDAADLAREDARRFEDQKVRGRLLPARDDDSAASRMCDVSSCSHYRDRILSAGLIEDERADLVPHDPRSARLARRFQLAIS